MNRVLTVILTKDREKEFERAVSSLLGQETDVFILGKPISKILRRDIKRAFEFSGQKLILKEGEFKLWHRNIGLNYAKKKGYKYIFFMDDDNIIPDNYLSRLVEKMEENKEIIGASGVIITYSKLKEKKYKQWRGIRKGKYFKKRGQEIIIKDKKVFLTTKIQVIPFKNYRKEIEVDYFVNSWLQRLDKNLKIRFPRFEILGEEMAYTYMLGKQGKLIVYQDLYMFHIPVEYGGTRERKDFGKYDREKEFKKVFKFILGFEPLQIIEKRVR